VFFPPLPVGIRLASLALARLFQATSPAGRDIPETIPKRARLLA
jgi:hypothetical protein